MNDKNTSGATRKPVRVLVVDDSATMRGLITAKLSSALDIEVVGGAADPFEAREAIKALCPDVVTLDVSMPRMDGITFLERIMRLRPAPVVMVSSQTEEGAAATIEALALGAVDCVPKPRPGQPDTLNALPGIVRAAANAQPRQAARAESVAPTARNWNGNLIAVGASTGGVEALTVLLSSFPADCPPTMIVQHMPAGFTETLASRLNDRVAPRVLQAKHGDKVEQGTVYIAPGGEAHMTVRGRSALRIEISPGPAVNGHTPSVDVLFSSVASICGDRAVGCILTGMGRDGASGLFEMATIGAETFGQDEASSVVYGMPRVAHELGAVGTQLSISRMGSALLEACEAQPAAERRSA